MSFKKTLLLFFFFYFIVIPLNWFVITFPVVKFNQVYAEIPTIVNNLISQTYPKDLVIDIKNGNLSINKPSPYCLIIDKDSKTGIMFDEKANPASLMGDKNPAYNPLCTPVALVGKTFVVYPDSSNKSSVKTFKINEIPKEFNYQLTRDKIEKLASDNLPKILKLAKNVYYLAPFILALTAPIFMILMNFWYTLIAWLAFKITKVGKEITYKKAYTKTFLVLFVWTAFNWIAFRIIGDGLLHLGFKLSFPFLGTIVITLGTILMEKFYFAKKAVNPTSSNINQPPSPTAPISLPTAPGETNNPSQVKKE